MSGYMFTMFMEHCHHTISRYMTPSPKNASKHDLYTFLSCRLITAESMFERGSSCKIIK